MDISEEDPVWLKAKADDFFRTGDYLSAVNAYSAAIDIDESMLSCFSNRSACYLKLRMYQECKDDCTLVVDALQNSQPPADIQSSQVPMKLKVMLRRGVSNCSLGFYDQALDDYRFVKFQLESGVELTGISVSSLDEDISRITTLISADELKKSADEKLTQNLLSEAISLYSRALVTLPLHVGCLANRATCFIALGELRGCIDDTTEALRILRSDGGKGDALENGISLLTSVLPPQGSEKRKSWLMKVLAKRGAAYAQLGDLENAISDYSQLLALDPKNGSIMSDLTRLKNLKAQNGNAQ